MVTLTWSHDATFDHHTAQGDGWREFTVTKVAPVTFVVTVDFVQGPPRDHFREVTGEYVGSINGAKQWCQEYENGLHR